MATRSDFNQVLLPFLDQAHALSNQGLALIDQLRPEELDGATMPAATAYRLHLVSTISYRSAVVCLEEPETSLSAYTLLRGLLEAWSHLSFIKDGGPVGDARCRALRFERGVRKEWEDSMRAAPTGFDRNAWSTQNEENKRDVEALWVEFGCKGANRTQANVRQTLKTLAEQPGMEWIDAVWQTTSATTHMYGVEFALMSRGDGTSEVVWALPSSRATWLMFLAAAYGYVTTTAAEILRPGAPATVEFHEAVRSLAENRELRKALAGDYDKDA
jgi:hypothetical protein